jgi:general secretion pathway protein H
MAVLVIIGIILTFMTLATGDRRAQELQREAERLVALLRLAGEEAVTRSEQLAVRVGDHDYAFLILADRHWVPLADDRPLRPRTLPESIELDLELQDNPPPDMGAEKEDPPQIFLLSSGEMTPFILTFSDRGTERRYRIKASLLGRLELE